MLSFLKDILILHLKNQHLLHSSAANCTFNNVVKTTVLMADMKVLHFLDCKCNLLLKGSQSLSTFKSYGQDYPAVNEVYAQFFSKEAAPARAAYQVTSVWLSFLYCFIWLNIILCDCVCSFYSLCDQSLKHTIEIWISFFCCCCESQVHLLAPPSLLSFI